MQPFKWPKWPKLCHQNPADIKEHAVLLGDEFKAVLEFLSASVSDRDTAPSLPRGIERKITKGVKKGLAEFESRYSSTTSISLEDRDLISNTILKTITAETAAAAHHRVPQYLFKILQDSYNELKIKIVTQEDAVPQRGTALRNELLPHTPPGSPPKETDSELCSITYGSDTEALAHRDYDKISDPLDSRIDELKLQLQEVECERKAVPQRLKVKAGIIKKEVQELELERGAICQRYKEVLNAIRKRRLEQDRTGDYGSEYVGYNVWESPDFHFDKRDENARRVSLKIESQPVVNRLFNMTADVLLRKAMAAVVEKSEPIEDKRFPTITHFLGAELQDDGDIRLWANTIDGFVWQESDAFEGLEKMPSWDQDIVSSFATHVTELSETYLVELKDVNLEMLCLEDRKRKAAVITDLVKHNVTAVPSLHIDVVKQICLYRRTPHDNTKTLVLHFSNPVTANEVLSHGLQWQGKLYPCEVYDPKFLDQCGHCQVYGHLVHDCTNHLRCGICTGQHRWKVCTSDVRRCALCDGPHRVRSSRCPARRARHLDKRNVRFPTGQDDQPFAIPTGKPDDSCSSTSSPTPDVTHQPAEHTSTTKECHRDPETSPNHTPPQDPQVEHTSTTEECHPDHDLTSVNTAPPDTPTLLARQLQDTLPAIEAALWSNISDMGREASLSATEIPLQFDDHKREKRRRLEEPATQVGLDDEIL